MFARLCAFPSGAISVNLSPRASALENSPLVAVEPWLAQGGVAHSRTCLRQIAEGLAKMPGPPAHTWRPKTHGRGTRTGHGETASSLPFQRVGGKCEAPAGKLVGRSVELRSRGSTISGAQRRQGKKPTRRSIWETVMSVHAVASGSFCSRDVPNF